MHGPGGIEKRAGFDPAKHGMDLTCYPSLSIEDITVGPVWTGCPFLAESGVFLGEE